MYLTGTLFFDLRFATDIKSRRHEQRIIPKGNFSDVKRQTLQILSHGEGHSFKNRNKNRRDFPLRDRDFFDGFT